MPDYTFNIFRIVDISGSEGLELAGSVTVRDDDGFRDTTLDDVEQAPPSETNGDQEIVSSTVSELDVGDTIRTRTVFRFTNNDTGERYTLTEVFSQTAGNPVRQLFILTSPAPDWLFDSTNRTLTATRADGTVPYSSIVCFGAGTLIKKSDGRDIAVEELKVGDRVTTYGGFSEVVRWIGSIKINSFDLIANPKLRPIRINAKALGCDLPINNLIVSRQHRVLINSMIVERIFGIDEVLIPAIKLTSLEGIEVADDIQEIEYYHILFDQHQIIYSNGAPTESLYTGPEALKSISDEAYSEITALYPELVEPQFDPPQAAFIPSRSKDVRCLIERHRKNKKPLLTCI